MVGGWWMPYLRTVSIGREISLRWSVSFPLCQTTTAGLLLPWSNSRKYSQCSEWGHWSNPDSWPSHWLWSDVTATSWVEWNLGQFIWKIWLIRIYGSHLDIIGWFVYKADINWVRTNFLLLCSSYTNKHDYRCQCCYNTVANVADLLKVLSLFCLLSINI